MATASYVASGSVPKLGGDFARAIASRQQTEYLISPSLFGEDEHPSKILRDKSEPGDRLGELYERMLGTDATLLGLEEKRTDAVIGLPWTIVPGDESDFAREIADTTLEMLYGIKCLETNLKHQRGATARGCAFEEMLWSVQRQRRGRLTGLWIVSELIDRPMGRFGFKDDVLHVRRKDATLEPVPPGRILHLAHGTKDTPWGVALLDQVWHFYWLTIHAWKYFGVAIEKWAQPTVLVRYDRSEESAVNESTVAAALTAAADFQTEYAVALPKDLELELKEAMRGGSVSYDGFLHLLDRAKALVFLGEVDTSGLAQGPGSFAKNRVSNEVRYEKIVADATELANSLTDGLITPFVRVNFGLDAPLPYWEFDVEEVSDRALRQNGAQEVLNRGLPVSESYMYRVHQVPMPKTGERVFRDPQIVGTVTVDREEDVEEGRAPLPPRKRSTPAETGKDQPAARHWSDQRLAA